MFETKMFIIKKIKKLILVEIINESQQLMNKD